MPDERLNNLPMPTRLVAEAIEHEVRLVASAALSFAEIAADIRESVDRLCQAPTPDNTLVDQHVSYLWDLVEQGHAIAESARRAFTFARDLNIQIAWNPTALWAVLEDPEFEPFMQILEEEPGDAIVLDDQQGILSYLGISRFEEIPNLLEARARNRAAELRRNIENVTYGNPCLDRSKIVLVSGHVRVCGMAEDPDNPHRRRRRCADVPAQDLLEFIIVAAILAAILGILYGIGVGLKRLFREIFGGGDRKGNAIRNKIEEWDSDQIASLSTRIIKMMLFEMINDGMGNRQERAVIKVLRALGCDRAVDELFFDDDVPHKGDKSVPEKHLNWITWIYNKTGGKEKSELIDWLSGCGLDFSSEPMSRDDIRNFIEHANCGTLSSLRNSQIVDILRRTLDGHVGGRRERAIIKLFRCLSQCERVRRILSEEGLSPRNFAEKVQGSEWEELSGLFRECGA